VLYSSRHHRWKLADFGISAEVIANQSRITSLARGTACYRPPEIINTHTYNKKTDIWALGCVIYELLTTERAFQSELDVYKYDVNSDITRSLVSSVSGEFRNLLKGMLSFEPSQRPTAESLLKIWSRFLRDQHTPFSSMRLLKCEECKLRNQSVSTFLFELIIQCDFDSRNQPCKFCYQHGLTKSCVKFENSEAYTEEQVDFRKLEQYNKYFKNEYPKATTEERIRFVTALSPAI
jgi:serine/threonine protein kinase